MKFIVMLCLIFPSMALAGGHARSVNLAAFQLVQGSSEFEGVVEGSLLDLLTTMKDKEMLAIIHTEGAYSGNVVTLQTSVLDDNAGDLGDYGIDCQLSFKEEGEPGEIYYSLGGICRINRVGRGKSEKFVLVIPPTPIPDTIGDNEEWFLFDEDEASGVGFYVNIGKQ